MSISRHPPPLSTDIFQQIRDHGLPSRAASPSIDIDKSVKETPRASDATPVLAAISNGGITKAKKKAKPMKRGQRARQERGLARAEVVMDQLAKKVDSVHSREKRRKDRRAIWEEVNDASKEDKRKTPKLPVGPIESDDEEWEDEPQAYEGDTEMKVVDGVQIPATAGSKLVVADRTTSTNASDAEDLEGYHLMACDFLPVAITSLASAD